MHAKIILSGRSQRRMIIFLSFSSHLVSHSAWRGAFSGIVALYHLCHFLVNEWSKQTTRYKPLAFLFQVQLYYSKLSRKSRRPEVLEVDLSYRVQFLLLRRKPSHLCWCHIPSSVDLLTSAITIAICVSQIVIYMRFYKQKVYAPS